MPRTIVTGGVGFIGYHVTAALLRRGEDVTVVDDFSAAPYPAFMKERNAQDLATEFGNRVEIVRACVTEKGKLATAFAAATGVIHLAGIAGVRPSFDDPTRYARVNVEGTGAIFELTHGAGISRLVIASSSSVYGNTTPLPAREDAPAIAPESPYAASKRGAELLVSALARKAKDLRVTALRFFTVYGPRQRPEMAITLFVRKILADQPITIFGDGSMKRDFTHVEDITRGVLAAYDASTTPQSPGGPREPRRGYNVYNLGSGAPITLADLVVALGAATGKTPKVERAPVPLGDVDATFADIARARLELGWSPKMPLTAGISSVVEWVRANPVSTS